MIESLKKMTDAANAGDSLVNNPLSPDIGESNRYRKQFYIMCAAVSVNHATVTAPIMFSSVVLTEVAGNASNATLYGTCLIVSLFFTNIAYSLLGSKTGLVLAMFLYSAYVGMFAWSAHECAQVDEVKRTCLEGSSLQVPLALIAAFLGGVGAGLLWTCQGAFYSMVCESLARVERRPTEEVTAEFAGIFGLIFLGTEAAVRASTTLLTDLDYAGLTYTTAFFIWTGFAFLSTAFFAFAATDLKPSSEVSMGSMCDKLMTAVALWRDPKLWLLQTTNITFGFAAAWVASYVGPNITSVALSSTVIGFAGALLSGLAAALSLVFAPMAAQLGKGPVITLGSLAFLCLGIFSKWVGNPSQWGWGAMTFYVLMGIGRAVYESTNKAIFADFFPKEKSPGAFANVFVFSTCSSSVAFLLGLAQEITLELYLMLIFAGLTPLCFFLASAMSEKGEGADKIQ